QKRGDAIENHRKWVDAARHLGCFAIRVNASGPGSADELGQNVVKGLYQLAAYAQPKGISVIVENHGGFSSDGQWLSKVIKSVNLPNCGTLPDFGNFNIRKGVAYDRYRGVKELMPYAKDVSAKTYDFDESGNETTIDYDRMMRIVKRSGYRGYIGIEYEGDHYTEEEGIMLTKKLLERYL
ncbi:MAG: sugar phosphate isomerase/epimerase, partial [Bacteroidales bacterium]|nr:sugar phosphate isomerase/epimerase [Bacteroidales bacterium]